MTLDEDIITTEYEEEVNKICDHKVVVYCGIQKDLDGRAKFALGNCVACDSTIDMTGYNYSGQKIYGKPAYINMKVETGDWLHQRMMRRT